MATPEHFDVRYVINPHMERHVGMVRRGEALRQWRRRHEAYEQLDVEVATIEGAKALPDMVFCANQTLPYFRPDSGERGVVLSSMLADQRRAEVPHFESYFERLGLTVRPLPPDFRGSFEGMGDAIWHPGRYLLWGGYGVRTDLSAYMHIAEMLSVRVLALRLDDPTFYHLDTCFSALDERTVLVYPPALTGEGRELVHHVFERVIEAPEAEARDLMACNAHCPDGVHVLIQRGCAETVARLREAGFVPVEVDTDEFLKAGGSVFCMKLTYW
jgi:N-dimethylarginine dimethylaminohydrolase